MTVECLKLETYVGPVPAYYAAVPLTFDLQSWKSPHRLLLHWGTFISIPFLMRLAARARLADGRTDSQTDGQARLVMRPRTLKAGDDSRNCYSTLKGCITSKIRSKMFRSA